MAEEKYDAVGERGVNTTDQARDRSHVTDTMTVTVFRLPRTAIKAITRSSAGQTR